MQQTHAHRTSKMAQVIALPKLAGPVVVGKIDLKAIAEREKVAAKKQHQAIMAEINKGKPVKEYTPVHDLRITFMRKKGAEVITGRKGTIIKLN